MQFVEWNRIITSGMVQIHVVIPISGFFPSHRTKPDGYLYVPDLDKGEKNHNSIG